MKRLLTIGVMWATVACGSNPVAPDEATLTGTWTGPVEESYGGRGTMRLVISQYAFSLAGEYAFAFDDSSRNRSGVLTGTTGSAGPPRAMQLSGQGGFDCGPDQSTGSFLFLDWVHEQGRLSGTYEGFGCVGTIEGAFDLRRER